MGRKKTNPHSKKSLPSVPPAVHDEDEIEESTTESDDETQPDDWQADDDASPNDSDTAVAVVEPDLDIKGSAGSTDPFRRYLHELGKYPLLPPEEEFRLAILLKEKGDMDAAKRLVSANLRLVVKIAMEYRSIYSNLLDLIQEGNIGLMKAVSKYDPAQGARLGYYASWWIRSYILKYLMDNFRLVKVGTTQAQKKLFYHLLREKEKLESQGLTAGPKLLADKLHVREKDVVEMQQRLLAPGAEVSLDAPIRSGDSKATHVEFLEDTAELPDQALARDQLLQMLHDKIPEFELSLNEKEKRILYDRILAEEPKTLQEVADLYGLTRERARQIEARVIEKLQKKFLGEM